MIDPYDAIIIGGGPGGSTAAMVMARAGFRVCLFEKDQHPRFHIGESILPRNIPLLRELGIASEIEKLPHVTKMGAEFGFGNDPKTLQFRFTDGLLPGFPVFNIERSYLDKMLLDQARIAGATVFENTPVKQIVQLADNAVVVQTASEAVRGRVLIDASGHGTVVGRHLKTRRGFEDPELQKVAYFQHFDNVRRLPGDATGHPTIIMCEEGWFWLIGVSATKTSVGFVTHPKFVKQIDAAPDQLLQWAIARCPIVHDRMKHATGPATNEVLADFSYTCKPFAGEGYFLVGDAACFLDPIFSTGVTLAMIGGKQAADLATQMLHRNIAPATARKRYIRFIEGSSGVFWKLIRNYYKHSFRELFMNGTGPLQVHRAVISTLAGQVFPKPVWALRWRLHFFHFCVAVQRYIPLVPRRKSCSLLREQPVEATPMPAYAQEVA